MPNVYIRDYGPCLMSFLPIVLFMVTVCDFASQQRVMFRLVFRKVYKLNYTKILHKINMVI